jgi:hypothetical protein
VLAEAGLEVTGSATEAAQLCSDLLAGVSGGAR